MTSSDLDRWREIARKHCAYFVYDDQQETFLWSETEVISAIAEAIAEERAHFNAALKRIHRMAEIGEPGICAVATEAMRKTESPTKETPK